MYWRREQQPDILSGQGRAASAEIEMTSYALLAILTRNINTPITEVIPIVRWLTGQRNAYGGFASTQVRDIIGCCNNESVLTVTAKTLVY